MDEVRAIAAATSPHYTFLVIDAVTGQDAVHTARAFHEALALSGLIVTKLDYDARRWRGALRARRRRTPGRLRLDRARRSADFDLFYPERMASRILGMGDVLSLIEQAERTMDADVVAESAGRMMSGTFTLDDFLAQLGQVRKMGSLGRPHEADARRHQGDAHRREQRRRRRARASRGDRALDDAPGAARPERSSTARGAPHREGIGHERVGAVNQLLKQFGEMRKMMRQMGGGSTPGAARRAGTNGGHCAAKASRRRVSCPRGFEALGAGMASAARRRAAVAQKQEEEGREGYPSQTTLNFDARVYRPVPVDGTNRFEGNFVVAVKLRLVRMGKKKQPTYRVVAAESRRARSGAFLEIVGTYQPRGLSAARARDGPQDRQREGSALAATGRPAHRARRQAAQDQRRPRRVRGRQRRPSERRRTTTTSPATSTRSTTMTRRLRRRTSTSTSDEREPTRASRPPRRWNSSPSHSPRTRARSRSKSANARARSSSRSASGANDMGRIIGRRGRTAQAIRALVGAAGARDGVTTSVDIVD